MKKHHRKVVWVVCFLVFVAFSGNLMAEAPAKININSASAEELAGLKGIGMKYAERIVAYREENGPFKKAEDITLVKGIGLKLYEKNKGCICVE